MKTKILIVIVLTAGLFTSQTMQAQGTLYVSNLGQTSTGSESIGNDSWLAQIFRTGTKSGGYVLNSVQLLMDATSGSPGGFSVSIYSSLNPANKLGNLSGSDPSTGGVFTYTASDLILSPSTYYFTSIPLNEKDRLLPLISQGNIGCLHEIRFRKIFMNAHRCYYERGCLQPMLSPSFTRILENTPDPVVPGFGNYPWLSHSGRANLIGRFLTTTPRGESCRAA